MSSLPTYKPPCRGRPDKPGPDKIRPRSHRTGSQTTQTGQYPDHPVGAADTYAKEAAREKTSDMQSKKAMGRISLSSLKRRAAKRHRSDGETALPSSTEGNEPSTCPAPARGRGSWRRSGIHQSHSVPLLPASKQTYIHSPFPEREMEMDRLWLLSVVQKGQTDKITFFQGMQGMEREKGAKRSQPAEE